MRLNNNNIMIKNSLENLDLWLKDNNYNAYDPFEGLNANIRFLTLENVFLRQILVQVVRRSPINIRPLLGIKPTQSSKGLGYIVRGDLKLFKLYKDELYKDRAIKI